MDNLLAPARSSGALDARHMNTTPPVVYAVIANNINLVMERLKLGADVNYEDPDKSTALAQAVHRDLYEIAELLIANGADINHVDSRGKRAIEYSRSKKMITLLGGKCAPPLNKKIDYESVRYAIACDGVDGFMRNGGWRDIPAFIVELGKHGLKEDEDKLKDLWDAIRETYDDEIDDGTIQDFFDRYYKNNGIRLSHE